MPTLRRPPFEQTHVDPAQSSPPSSSLPSCPAVESGRSSSARLARQVIVIYLHPGPWERSSGSRPAPQPIFHCAGLTTHPPSPRASSPQSLLTASRSAVASISSPLLPLSASPHIPPQTRRKTRRTLIRFDADLHTTAAAARRAAQRVHAHCLVQIRTRDIAARIRQSPRLIHPPGEAGPHERCAHNTRPTSHRSGRTVGPARILVAGRNSRLVQSTLQASVINTLQLSPPSPPPPHQNPNRPASRLYRSTLVGAARQLDQRRAGHHAQTHSRQLVSWSQSTL